MANKKLEKSIAETFLRLLNVEYGTKWQILKEQESPDFICEDSMRQVRIGLEISLVEEIPGQIKHIEAGGPRPVSPISRMTSVTFDDAWDSLMKRLREKSKMKYGPHTALLLYPVTIIWRKNEWQAWKECRLDETNRDEYRKIFDLGVWLLCSEGHQYPMKSDLLLFVEPSIDNLLFLIEH